MRGGEKVDPAKGGFGLRRSARCVDLFAQTHSQWLRGAGDTGTSRRATAHHTFERTVQQSRRQKKREGGRATKLIAASVLCKRAAGILPAVPRARELASDEVSSRSGNPAIGSFDARAATAAARIRDRLTTRQQRGAGALLLLLRHHEKSPGAV